MSRIRTLQELFQRYPHPCARLFAAIFLVFSIVLLVLIPDQTTWIKRTNFFSQPAFWPSVSIGLMVVFSSFHFLSTVISKQGRGSWGEVFYWLKSFEYVMWFMAYVFLVPLLGYLLSTTIFSMSLAWRIGYKSMRWQLVSVAFSVIVVVIFKGFLSVKIPSGDIYNLLPPGQLRLILMSYF